MSYISVEDACKAIGVSSAAICRSKKYKRFYKKSDKNKHNAKFDLQAYLKHEALKEELLEKTKLFVEYMRYEKNINYTYLSKKTGVNKQTLSKLSFGYDVAFKIVKTISNIRPSLLMSFDEYYGWKPAKAKRHYNEN